MKYKTDKEGWEHHIGFKTGSVNTWGLLTIMCMIPLYSEQLGIIAMRTPAIAAFIMFVFKSHIHFWTEKTQHQVKNMGIRNKLSTL